MRRLALALLVALALPGAAFGHAGLVKGSPGYRERVERGPARILLHFDQRVTALPNAVVVYAADGKVVSGAARTEPDAREVTVPLRRLPKGPYTVRWHVLSSDGHVVSGVYTFGVRYPAPPPTQAYGASGPTTAEHVVRWAYFLSLALLLGGLAFRLLVLPRSVPPRLARRFFWIGGIGVVAVIEVGILAFLLRAEDALQLPFERFLYGDLSPMANGTRFGRAFMAMTLGYALVAALLFLAWLSDRLWPLWPALLIGLGFASGLSLSGHSAVDAGASWASQLADWAHLSAASIWVGGLVMLAFAVWPAAPELRRAAFLRFSRLAPILLAALLAAGIYLSILRLPYTSDLWRYGYGRVLLVKLALVAIALAWGAFHHFLIRPVLERPGRERFVGRVSRSLLGEGAVGVAVLLLAAVLVDSKPPPQPPAPGPVQAAVVRR